MNYLYIFGTIFFTVYGQLIIKWRIGNYGALPEIISDRILFLLRLLLDPFIFSGFFAAFLASLCWMAAMTKFQLSYAYPFMSLAFVMVLIFSNIFFREPITIGKSIGMGFIVLGIIFGSRG